MLKIPRRVVLALIEISKIKTKLKKKYYYRKTRKDMVVYYVHALLEPITRSHVPLEHALGHSFLQYCVEQLIYLGTHHFVNYNISTQYIIIIICQIQTSNRWNISKAGLDADLSSLWTGISKRAAKFDHFPETSKIEASRSRVTLNFCNNKIIIMSYSWLFVLLPFRHYYQLSTTSNILISTSCHFAQ